TRALAARGRFPQVLHHSLREGGDGLPTRAKNGIGASFSILQQISFPFLVEKIHLYAALREVSNRTNPCRRKLARLHVAPAPRLRPNAFVLEACCASPSLNRSRGMFRNWLYRWLSPRPRVSRRACPTSRKEARRRPLTLDVLEDRTLLSFAVPVVLSLPAA